MKLNSGWKREILMKYQPRLEKETDEVKLKLQKTKTDEVTPRLGAENLMKENTVWIGKADGGIYII